jgi:hypothetical protein
VQLHGKQARIFANPLLRFWGYVRSRKSIDCREYGKLLIPEPRDTAKAPNADEKRALKAASVRTFVQQYARKAHRGHDPNDRRYNRDAEKSIKRMRPDELDRLLRDDGVDTPTAKSPIFFARAGRRESTQALAK